MLSVGELLKTERERQSITLQQVEKYIKVREKFLRAIELNNWDFFSSKIYISGIIKNYARYLKLDPRKMLAFFRRDYEKKETVRFKRKVSSKYLTPETRKIVLSAIVFICILFLSYFGYQLNQFFSPPKVTILAPRSTDTVREDKIKIIGKTEKEAYITIFGEKVFPNKEGIFEYEFPVKKGSNTLEIEVIGANGKKTVIKKEFTKI